jgi:5-methyltetrahydropteroyltriglutamate--homocysteine methyltransferase
MADTFRFHADHVGSLLRPPALLEAERRVEAGMIEPEELREVQNEAITAAIKLQKQAGLTIFTDGEYRRPDFRGAILGAVDGITTSIVEMPWHGPDGVTTLPSVQYTVTDRLKQHRRLFDGDVEFLRTLTRGHLKFTLIAPGFLAERCWKDGVTDQVYSSREELGEDLARIIRSEIEALLAEGVIYVQLDNPGYAAFLGDHARNGGENGHNGQSFERMLAVDIAAVEGIERPDGACIAMHVCRGNQASYWLAEGDYSAIAEKLFGSLPVQRFLLEFDDERSGGFEPLRYVPEGTHVVLGLISSKDPHLEDLEALQQRIDAAAELIEIDDLALSPQCGFASVGRGGNKLTPEEELAKLRLVADTAVATWGFET